MPGRFCIHHIFPDLEISLLPSGHMLQLFAAYSILFAVHSILQCNPNQHHFFWIFHCLLVFAFWSWLLQHLFDDKLIRFIELLKANYAEQDHLQYRIGNKYCCGNRIGIRLVLICKLFYMLIRALLLSVSVESSNLSALT